jgi:hypothetical protein
MFDGAYRTEVFMPKYYFQHHFPAYRLETAAKENCYVCKCVWNALLPRERALLRNASRLTGLLCRSRWIRTVLEIFGRRINDCYGWKCNFDRNRLEFVFGSEAVYGWKTIKFNLLHADGQQNTMNDSSR